MKFKMVNSRIKSAMIIALLGLIIILFFSISTLVITVLLGLLFIPPALLLASFFIEGIPVMIRELGAALESGKEWFVISISRDSIVLEPNLNR